MTMLRDIVFTGYREISFYGVSSGGFASILFGELLASEFPDLRVRTVSINPQTVLGEEHETAIRAVAPFINLPHFIEPDALSQSDCDVANIPDLVRSLHRGNVEHRVIFDVGNQTEAYYGSFLNGLAKFDLRRIHLGLPHREGIMSLRDTEEPDALRWALEP